MIYDDSTWIYRLCLELAFLARKLGVKVVFIESCSGGLCSSWITSIAGCSAWFEGGFVTYSNQMKQSVLRIDKKIIDKHGAVSRIVANKMVVSPSLKSFKGIVSTSVTGIAGPQGGTQEKPVGLVFFGWQGPWGADTEEKCFNGSRGQIQSKAAFHAISGLSKRIALVLNRRV